MYVSISVGAACKEVNSATCLIAMSMREILPSSPRELPTDLVILVEIVGEVLCILGKKFCLKKSEFAIKLGHYAKTMVVNM